MQIRLIIFFALLVTACSTNYRISDNQVEYITWNEAHGRVARKVKDADAKTFKQLTASFGIDKDQLYWQGSVVKGADVNTFRIITNNYGADANHGIVNGAIIKESVGANFEYLGNSWFRDGRNYFYQNEMLPVCDYDSFKIIPGDLLDRAQDKDCLYYRNDKVPVKDMQSLQILPAYYAKDRFLVYWGASVIPGADPASFVVKGDESLSIAKDKNSCFSGTQVLTCDDLNENGKSFCDCPK